MKLLSYYAIHLKKTKCFHRLKEKINDCWDVLMNSIIHQPEVDFFE